MQLDHTNGGIVTYWSNIIGGSKTNDVIVPLTALGEGTKASTWYRFRVEITKLTETSAQIDVSLVELDAGGNPIGTPLIGSIADTSLLASGHTPDEGYFTANSMWPSYKNYTTAPAPADNTCYQVVTSDEYALTIIQATGGTITADPAGPYNYNDPVTITATPDLGYSFDGWTGDCAGQGNPCTLTMDAAKSVSATFTQIEYALTITQATGGTITADPAGPYYYNDPVTITATAETGYSFDAWTGDCAGQGNPCTLTMDAAKSVSAYFHTD